MRDPILPLNGEPTLTLTGEQIIEIHQHGEAAYPDEGAGFLLGEVRDGKKTVVQVLKLPNSREEAARRNRYLLTPADYLRAEQVAENLELEVIGVFHSHPDHPELPSEFDREWALPWFSYLITSVQSGKALASRSWTLREDRAQFDEESIAIHTAGTLSGPGHPNS